MAERLVYDLTELAGTAAAISEVAGIAREVDDHNKRMAATVGDCGSTALARSGHDFLKSWAYGMQLIADDAEGMGQALQGCAEAYAAVDEAATRALRR